MVKCAELWLYVTLWEDVLLVVFSGVNVASWPVLPNHKHPVAISGHAYAQLSAVLPHHLSKMTCREKHSSVLRSKCGYAMRLNT